MSAAAAVAALAGQAPGAPVSSVGPDARIDMTPVAVPLAPFEATRLEWDMGPGEIPPPPAGVPTEAGRDASADAIVVPTPGTAALAAIAGLVVILPRRRG